MPRIIAQQAIDPHMVSQRLFQTPEKHRTQPRNHSPDRKPEKHFDVKGL